MARKNAIVSVEETGTTLIFNVEGHKAITLDRASLSEEILSAAMMHGLKQKISDAAALPRNDDGSAASPSDKHAAMVATVERLLSGEWNKRGDGTGEGPVGGIIFRALQNVKSGTDPEKLRAWYDGKTRSEQLALRSVPEIAAEIERIKSERGANSKVDGAAVMSELDNL